MTLFHLQSQQWLVESLSHHSTLSHSSASSHLCNDLCDYIGPTGIICPLEGQMISNLNSIYKFNSSLLCNITYSQVPRTRCGHLWWQQGEGEDIILGTTAIYNSLGTLELGSNFFPFLHWFPLYSSEKIFDHILKISSVKWYRKFKYTRD